MKAIYDDVNQKFGLWLKTSWVELWLERYIKNNQPLQIVPGTEVRTLELIPAPNQYKGSFDPDLGEDGYDNITGPDHFARIYSRGCQRRKDQYLEKIYNLKGEIENYEKIIEVLDVELKTWSEAAAKLAKKER